MTTETPSQSKRPDTGYRLFKRDDAGNLMHPDAPGYRERDYYFQVQIDGKRYLRNLLTNDKAQAQINARAKAREIKDAVMRQDLGRLQSTKQRHVVLAVVQKIIDAYKTSPVDAGKGTRTRNVTAFLRVVGAAAVTEPVSAINAEAVRQYFAKRSAEMQAVTDQSEQASIKRSANSTCHQARGLFVPKALAHYKALSLYHPAMQEFSAAFKVHRFTRIPALDFNPPSETVIDRTLAAWEKIEDRNLFLAIGHELAFGLRAGELAQAKWSWWTQRQGYPVLDGTANVKNGSGIVQVRALDPFFNIMRARIEANSWMGKPDDYIISGTDTMRKDAIFRAVTSWLRAQGWGTQKTNHALRAYAGSQVAMKYGIYDAQTFLRHSTVKVTEAHYSHFVRKFKPADLDTIPVRWAVLRGAPKLEVVTKAA